MAINTGPIAQSFAALFSPESERNRVNQKDASEGKPIESHQASLRTQKMEESGATQDSLGNPSTPGYEMIWQKKKSGTPLTEEEERILKDPNYVPAKKVAKGYIYLQTGWEKLLVAQKKICEKTRNLFTHLEATPRYTSNQKNRLIAQQKSGNVCGFIVDVDSQEYLEEQAQKAKLEKAKEDAA